LPEREGHPASEARDIADRLVASFGSMLLYWWHFTRNGRRIDTETDDDSVAAHFLHLLHGEPPSELHADALDKSLILNAEHEFNASTFTARVIAGTGSDLFSCITGAIGALRGPKHGGANEVAMDIIRRYTSADKSLTPYAEHEFHASTFTALVIAGTGSALLSCLTGAIGALRGPTAGGASEVALHITSRYTSAVQAEADTRDRMERKEIIIGFG